MRNYLVLDADRSLATIGGNQGCEQRLGVPPVRITDVDSVLNKMLALFVKERIEKPHPLFPDQTEVEERIGLNETAKAYGLDGIVLDTLSTVGTHESEAVKKLLDKTIGGTGVQFLDMQGYGVIKDRFIRLMHFIKELDFAFIVNAHVKKKEDDIGAITEVPDIPGSSATMLKRVFDIIVYNRVLKGPDGESVFRWQVQPDERRMAKDRLDVLEHDENGYIEQDFDYLLSAYERGGVPHPKILVIGDSGTGKTRALATINPQRDTAAKQDPAAAIPSVTTNGR